MVIFKAIADFSDLTREAAKALAELEALKKAAQNLSDSEINAGPKVAAARREDVAALKEEAAAMHTVAQNADIYNRQVNWAGATSETQHQANMAREVEYRRLLNIQLQRGFYSPQQNYAWRQQELAQQLNWNRALQQGYTTPEQYLGFLSAHRQAMQLENVAWGQRIALLKGATDAQLGHSNALQGTHLSITQLVGSAAQAQAAVSALGSTSQTASAALDDSELRMTVAADMTILGTLGSMVATPKADLDASGFVTGAAAIEAALARMAAARAAYTTAIPVSGDTGRIAMTGGTNVGAGPPSEAAAGTPSDIAAIQAARAADNQNRAAASAENLRRQLLAAGLSADEASAQMAKFGVAADRVAGKIDAIAASAVEAQAELYQLSTSTAEPVLKLNDNDFLSRITRDMAMLAAAREKLAISAAPDATSARFTAAESRRIFATPRIPTEITAGSPLQAVTAGSQPLAIERGTQAAYAASTAGRIFTSVEDAMADAAKKDAAAFDAEADAVRRVSDEYRVFRTSADGVTYARARDAAEAEREAAVREAVSARTARIDAAATAAKERAEYLDARSSAAAMYMTLGQGKAAADAAAKLEDMAHAANDASESSHYMWASQVAARIATSQLSDAAKESATAFIRQAAAQNTGADAAHRAYDAQVALARATRDAGGAAAVAAAAAGKGGGGGALAAWAAVNAAGAGGGRTFFGIPNPQLPLFNGAIASPAFLRSMSVLSLAIHLLIDFILTAVPAAITMLVGLGAFAAGAYPTVQAIVGQMKNINTVGEALNKTIPPMTGALQKMQDAVQPKVMTLFGEGLKAINNQASQNTLSDWALRTGSYLDKLGARFVAYTQRNGDAFRAFLDRGGQYLAQFGSIGNALLSIFSTLAKGGQITTIAYRVLEAWALVFRLLANVLNMIGPIGTAAIIAFYALIHYGGLISTMAQTTVEWLLLMGSKLPGVSALVATLSQKLGLSNDALVNIGKNTAKMDAVAASILRGETNAAAMGAALVGSDANLVKVVSRQPEIAKVAAAFKLSAEQVAANAIAFGKLPGGIDQAARASGNLSQDIVMATGKMGTLERSAALVAVASAQSSDEASRGLGRIGTAAEGAGSKVTALGKLGGSVAGFLKANWVLAAAAIAAGLGVVIDKIIIGTNATQAFYDKTQAFITGSSIQNFSSNVQTAISDTTRLMNVSKAAIAPAQDALVNYQHALDSKSKPALLNDAQAALSKLTPGTAAYFDQLRKVAALQSSSGGSQETLQQAVNVSKLAGDVGHLRDVYAGYQSDLKSYQAEQAQWDSNLQAIMRATGTDAKGAKALIVQAGITTNQMLDSNKQHLLATQIQVEATQQAYKAMSLGVDRTAASLNALNYAQGADANQLGTIDTQMTKIISAQDQLQGVLLGSEQGFVNVTSALHTLGTDAKVSGASLSGLNDASLKLSGDFYSTVLPALQKQNDALQMQNISTTNLTTVIASQVAYALPYAKGNLAARDSLVSFINQGLGPSTVNLKSLDSWVSKNSTNLGGWKKIVDQTTIAASGFAGVLTTALNTQLTQSVIQFTGAGLAQAQYAKDLLASTQATAAGKSDRWHLITDLMNAGMNAKDAAAFVDGLTRKLAKVPPKVTTTVQVSTAAAEAAAKKIHDDLRAGAPQITPVVDTKSASRQLAILHQNLDMRPKTITPVVDTKSASRQLALLHQSLDARPKTITPVVDTTKARQSITQFMNWLNTSKDPSPASVLGTPKGSAAKSTPSTIRITLDSSGIQGQLLAVAKEIAKELAPPSSAAWIAFFRAIGGDFNSSVVNNVTEFFKTKLPQFFARDVSDWDKLWTGSQKSFVATVEDALKKFFQSTMVNWLATFIHQWQATFTKAWGSVNTTIVVNFTALFGTKFPGWFTSLGSQWSTLWTNNYSKFQQVIEKPITQWFTASLPTAIQNSFRLSLDKVITGPLDNIVKWINSISATVGIAKIQPPTPFAAGGSASSMAQAGSVGGAGEADTVHAMLMPGEWVMRKSARSALESTYGPGIMGHLNQADSWLGSGSRGTLASQGFAGGGSAHAAGDRNPQQYAPGGGVIAADAQKYVGHPYHFGGPSNPTNGWDCSSFTSYVLGHDMGMAIPGGSWASVTNSGAAHGPTAASYLSWSGATTKADQNPSHTSPGDLLTWPTHVGFAYGPNEMISAYDTSSGTIDTVIAGAGPGGEQLTIRTINGVPGSPAAGTGFGQGATGSFAKQFGPLGAALVKAAGKIPGLAGGTASFDALWKALVVPLLSSYGVTGGKGMSSNIALVMADKIRDVTGKAFKAAQAKAAAAAAASGGGSPFTGPIGPVSQTVAKYLMANGASKAGAAGIAATIFGESGNAGPEAVGSGGFGLIGWTGNTIGLPAGYTGPTGNVAKDYAAQLPGIIGYARSRPGGWPGAFNFETDPVVAGNIWSAYEAPAKALSDTRPALAQQLYAQGLASGGDVLAFGASTTRGAGATAGKDYVSDLARLSGGRYHFRNAGISGNRLVTSGGTGPEGEARFGGLLKGITDAIVWEGINDIGAGTQGGAIKEGYEDIISAAHAHSIKVVGGTLQPAGFSSAKEHQRESVNQWIRGSGKFDAVADFDKALRDPKHPSEMASWVYNRGQAHGNHPGNAGYAAAARVAYAALNSLAAKAVKKPAKKTVAPAIAGPSPWAHVIATAKGTQLTEHTLWGRFLNKLKGKKLTAAEHKNLRGLEATQRQEEHIFNRMITDAERWNSHLGEVSEAPGPMDALFREMEKYIASYDKHLLAQPFTWAGTGKKRHKVPAGWRALGAFNPDAYAAFEQGVAGMRVPVESLASMWGDLRYPAEPGLLKLPGYKYPDPKPQLPGMKGTPPASYASGGSIGLGGMLDQLSVMPRMAAGGSIGMPDLSAVARQSAATAPSVRSTAAQATSGTGGSTNVNFGDVIVNNPVAQAAPHSITSAVQKATWLAGREL